MKSIRSIKVFLAFSFCFINATCKKGSTHTPINIELDNAPLSVVKNYISGKWKLVYTYGGFSPHTTYEQNNYFEFKENDTLIQTYNNETLTNDTIHWVRYPNGNDFFNIMTYEDINTLPNSKVPLKIYNDTFIMKDLGPDGFNYHLIKN